MTLLMGDPKPSVRNGLFNFASGGDVAGRKICLTGKPSERQFAPVKKVAKFFARN
jgi:hypothetical protein